MIKIETNNKEGLTTSSNIVVSHDGVELKGITNIDFSLSPDEFLTAKVSFQLEKMSVQADCLVFAKDLITGEKKQVKKVVFEDGTVFDTGDLG
jgi:hypothetical protein